MMTTSKSNSIFLEILEGSPWYRTIVLLQNGLIHATFDFFKEKEIYSVCLPITTGSVTSPMGLGSDSLPVEIDIFGVKQYLSDSMQFHLEYILRLVDQGVHYLMPSFRGEKTDKRHLAQFYHSESEIVGDLDKVVNLVNEYITYLTKYMLENYSDQISTVAGTTIHLEELIKLNGHIPRVSFEEAVELLEHEKDSNYFYYDVENDFLSITPAGEKYLIGYFNGAVWVTNFPYKSVPFYQKRTEDGKYAKNADLLMGIGETVGAGERCYDKIEVIKSMEDLNVDSNEYDWYMTMKEKKPIQTSGFGMGTERYLLWLLNHDDIRDVQPIPRVNGLQIEP